MPSEKPLVHLVVDEELLAAIEAYRRAQPKIPSRAKAIKDLLKAALDEIDRREAAGLDAGDIPPPDDAAGTDAR